MNVQSANYWSAAAHVGSPAGTWAVDFSNSNVGRDGKLVTNFGCCVRDPMQEAVY